MKKVLLAAMLVFGLLGGYASADECPGLCISTGSEGGGYDTKGQALEANFRSIGIEVVRQTSKGSNENVERLVGDGPTNAAFMQADVMMHRIKAAGKQDLFPSLFIVAELGQECLFALTSYKGGLSQSQMQSSGNTRTIVPKGGAGGGPATSWEYVQKLEDNFEHTRANLTVDLPTALIALKDPNNTLGVGAVLFVQGENLHDNATLTAAKMLDRRELTLVPLTDWDLDDRLPNGKQVYTYGEKTFASTEKGWFGTDYAVDTICTTALFVVNTAKLPEQLKGKILLEFSGEGNALFSTKAAK